jgi:hypothetical protein
MGIITSRNFIKSQGYPFVRFEEMFAKKQKKNIFARKSFFFFTQRRMPQKTKNKTKCMGDYGDNSDIEYHNEYSTQEMNDTPHVSKKSKTRETLLDELNEARWNHNAEEIIRIMQSKHNRLFTADDIHYLYINTLCRAANDQFAQDLFELKAIEIFHQAFPKYVEEHILSEIVNK